jgi:hypothetical protein
MTPKICRLSRSTFCIYRQILVGYQYMRVFANGKPSRKCQEISAVSAVRVRQAKFPKLGSYMRAHVRLLRVTPTGNLLQHVKHLTVVLL